jgi:hypothetical protein
MFYEKLATSLNTSQKMKGIQAWEQKNTHDPQNSLEPKTFQKLSFTFTAVIK